MKSLHARARVVAHGTLPLPPDMAGQEVELIVVFEPVTVTKTDELPTEVAEWPPGFFEQTAGAWQGDPLRREPQGESKSETRWGDLLT